MATWQFNPILVREVRARWRNWPAFAVVLGYATFLALVVGWRYLQFASKSNFYNDETGAKLGHELFVTLTFTQVLGWMVIAPILTASSIQNEREQGLLEGLLLSHLTPGQIIKGKLLSALSFIVLMLLAPLPIIAVCFLLGGLSPGELIMATLLHFTTAMACSVTGLSAAAWHNGRGAVLWNAFTRIVVWSVIIPIPLCGVISPIAAAGMILSDEQGAALIYTGASLIFMSGLSFHMLDNAVRGLRRPLSQQLKESSQTLNLPPVLDYILVKRVTLPFVSHLRFVNPILQRDIHRRLSVRRVGIHESYPYLTEKSVAVDILMVYLILALPLYLTVTSTIFWFLAYTWLIVVLILGVIFGAETFAHEKEQETWEALMLTPLSLRQIIGGKLGAVLFACGYYSVPLIVTLVLYALNTAYMGTRVDYISPGQVLSVMLVVAASLWCCANFGLLISWLCKRVWIAVSWTLTSLFLALVLIPQLVGIGGNWLSMGIHYLNPWYAVSATQDNSSQVLKDALIVSLALFGLGSLFMGMLHYKMAKSTVYSK